MRARTLMLAGLFYILLAPAAARAAVIYSQPDQSGAPLDVSGSYVAIALLGAPAPTSAPLWFDLRLKAPHLGRSSGIVLTCADPRNGGTGPLQTLPFPSAAIDLLADGQFHDLHLRSAAAAVPITDCDPSGPLAINFYELGEGAEVAASASSTPYLVLTEDPPQSKDASYVLATGGTESPPYAYLGGYPELMLDRSASLVATGTMSDFVAPITSDRALTGDESYYLQRIYLYSGQAFDCQSAPKSAAELGLALSARDLNAPLVDFKLSGKECALGEAINPAIYPNIFVLRRADGSEATELHFLSGKGGIIPWVAYANGLPTAAPPQAKDSSVLFIPGTEASRLYMQTPMGEKQVWEPAWNSDIPYLAINQDGTSANNLYTKDIVDTVFSNYSTIRQTIAKTFDAEELETYSGLEQFLNGLVASSTIAEWRAYPYDWRYDPIDIVNNGTLTEEANGSIDRVYLAHVLEDMASSSPTGKVTIIAHSNGGLLAKALVEKLGPSASSYIDRIILVGTPQLGTPSAIGVLLHGDGVQIALGIVVAKDTFRKEAAIIPDGYALLPAPEYFSRVGTPVIKFGSDPFLAPLRQAYGGSITDYGSLESFLDDGKNVDEQYDNSTASAPQPLSLSLLAKEKQTQETLLNWQPGGIAVTAIAGWGQLTSATLSYTKTTSHTICTRSALVSLPSCTTRPLLQHTEIKTKDGDGTVVSPSAIGDVPDSWYFDAGGYQGGSYSHQDLTSTEPVQSAIFNLLENKSLQETRYLFKNKPDIREYPLTVISSHSPVSIVATDAGGNKTGVIPVPNSDLYLRVSEIPGSAVEVAGDSGDEYLTLPQDGTYTITATGNGNGPTTLEVENVDEDGNTTNSESFTDIPTTASTTATFSVVDGVPSAPAVDIDGDGTPDFQVASDTPAALSPSMALALIHEQVAALEVRPGVKNRLLVQIEKLESEQDALASAQSDVSWLETLIKAQTGVKLTTDEGASLLSLLNYLKIYD